MILWNRFAKLFTGFLVLVVSVPVIILMAPVLILKTIFSGPNRSAKKPVQKPAFKEKKQVRSKPVPDKTPKQARKASDLKWIDDLEDLQAALDD